ncbi:hypothetical protein [Chryseobacterium sp.]|uniref:hypothetical protein n=1 Tax=Chryseobacterium sp. TaxID=1871047 RepID=UPI0012C026C9|nr:hypothetical protein [Chryseobacterium sp.]MPS66834.1 hypothetical protein [Chryseobacterium sp.]
MNYKFIDAIEKLTVNYLIINYLKDGLAQPEIAEKLREKGIKPNSLSSIEKRIKQMRDYYNAKTLVHLAFILSNNYNKGKINPD